MAHRCSPWLTVAILATTSCKPSSSGSPWLEVSRHDSAGVSIVTIAGDLNDLPRWSLPSAPALEISGDQPPFLGSVGEVALLEAGGILVEDDQTKELRIFDAMGRHHVVGGAGEGPGEFQTITSLSAIAGDTFYAYDLALNRVSSFDADGRLLETLVVSRREGGPRTTPQNAWAFASDHLVLERMGPYDTTNTAAFPRRDQRDVVLFPLHADGTLRGATRTFTGGYTAEFAGGRSRAAAPFANRPSISVRPDRLAYTSGLDYEITIVNRVLEPNRVIRWPGWRQPLTADAVQTMRGAMHERLAQIRNRFPQVADQMMEAIFSADVVPDTLPALGPLILSDTGEIWVSVRSDHQ